GIRSELDAVRELEDGRDEPSLVRTTGEEDRLSVGPTRNEAEGFGDRGDRRPGAFEDRSRPRALAAGNEERIGKLAARSGFEDVDPRPLRLEGRSKLPDRPADRRPSRERVLRVAGDRHHIVRHADLLARPRTGVWERYQ